MEKHGKSAVCYHIIILYILSKIQYCNIVPNSFCVAHAFNKQNNKTMYAYTLLKHQTVKT